MNCPFCGSDELKVIDKRNSIDFQIRRRRECTSCSKRFTTYESVIESEIFVLKKDGSKERFSKEKLKEGIILACKKTPVSINDIDDIVSSVKYKLKSIYDDNPITTDYIGNLVLDKLKNINDVAYIRFASIFKNFNSISDFRDEILSVRRD